MILMENREAKSRVGAEIYTTNPCSEGVPHLRDVRLRAANFKTVFGKDLRGLRSNMCSKGHFEPSDPYADKVSVTTGCRLRWCGYVTFLFRDSEAATSPKIEARKGNKEDECLVFRTVDRIKHSLRERNDSHSGIFVELLVLPSFSVMLYLWLAFGPCCVEGVLQRACLQRSTATCYGMVPLSYQGQVRSEFSDLDGNGRV